MVNKLTHLIDLPAQNIKGIIFDCDGTLVDTMPVHNKAWAAIFQKYDIKTPLSYLDRFASCPSWMLAKDVFEKENLNLDYNTIGQEKEDLYFEYLDSAEAYPKVIEYVKEYYGKLPMAVLSGGGRKGVIKSLEFHDLVKYFDFVIAADDGYSPKSETQVWIDVANKFKINPSECLVFEDGDVGINSAKKAGMKIIDVRKEFNLA